MADDWSFVIADQIELLGTAIGVPSTLPECPGATFILDQGWDFGAPQPVTDSTATMVTDGERPYGRRASNRTLKLPVNILAPDPDTLVAAREVLFRVVDEDAYEAKWTRHVGAPTVAFDCFRALPSTPEYSLTDEASLVAPISLQIPALPYARSLEPQVLSFLNPRTIDEITPFWPGAAGSPIILDTFSSLPSGNPGWSVSINVFPDLATSHDAVYSVSGTTPVAAPTFTSRVFTSVDLSQHTAFKFWAGLSTNNMAFTRLKAVHVSYKIRLFDSSGHTVSFGGRVRLHPGEYLRPTWQRVSFRMPRNLAYYVGAFDYTDVVQYSITISNTPHGTFARYTPWIAYVEAYPATSATASIAVPSPGTSRGAVYRLNGVQGSARAPLSLTVQQYSVSGFYQETVSFTASDNWYAPASMPVSPTVSASITGRGGDGGDTSPSGTPAAGAGGGGGGERGLDPAIPVTAGGGPYPVTFGTTANSFTGDFSHTLSAANGSDASGSTHGAGGSGATVAGQTHYAGGDGADGTLSGSTSVGGGGGASASDTGAGATATGQPGAAGAGTGASGGDGSDGTDPDNLGGNPGNAPGSGGGGASVDSVNPQSGGDGDPGIVELTYFQGVPNRFKTVLVHRPNWDSSDMVPIYVPLLYSGPKSFGTRALASGATFHAGDPAITSPNMLYSVNMGALGNFATHYANGDTTYNLPPFLGKSGGYMELTAAGELRYHDSDGFVWSNNTAPPASWAGAELYLMNDGNLCEFDTSGNVVWSTYSTPGAPGFGEPILAPVTKGFNPRFGGTYSVLLSVRHWDNEDEEHTISCMVRQAEYRLDKRDSPVISRTFVPSELTTPEGNGFVEIGVMTIPDRRLPPENTTAYYKIRVTSDHPLDVWQDLMFLDTQGSTVLINVTGTDTYNQYYIDEPTADVDIGIISGSRYDRSQAIGLLDKTWVSGGPIMAEPGDNLLFVYSREGPAAVMATYFPRWMVDSSEDPE